MTNSNEQATIQFWKLKTFNEKLNASISFLRVHWKPLLKANATIAGPFFVLGIGLLLFHLMVFTQNITFNPDQFNDEFQVLISLFFIVFISGILYMISLIGIILVTFEYIKLVQENSPNQFNTRVIFKNCRKRFWKLILAGLFSVLIFFGLSIVASLISIPLVLIPILGVILVFLTRFGINLFYYCMLYIYIPMNYYEQTSVTKAFKRSKNFIMKDFWTTIGMYLGNRAIQYVLANGLLIPFVVAIFWWLYKKIQLLGGDEKALFTENRYIFIIFMLVIFFYLLVNTTFNIFHILSSAVQYFSLKEKNDGDSIFEQIEHFETITDEV